MMEIQLSKGKGVALVAGFPESQLNFPKVTP